MSTPTRIDQDGTQIWLKDGQLHRLDLPAIIYADGKRAWSHNGLWHRDDGSSYTAVFGVSWRVHGNAHREDGPAYIWPAAGKERKEVVV